MHRIFISYKRLDKDTVFKIKDRIETALGERCWIDLDGIESDAIFKSVIIKAINECEVLLFMYSKAHSEITDFEKDWTIKELNFASYKKKRIVFINIDGSPLSDLFAFDYDIKQQIDGCSSEALERLCDDLRKWLHISPLQCPTTDSQQRGETMSAEDMIRLAESYLVMKNGKIDYAQAANWYRKAAETGNAKAQFCLGECYFYGDGVLEDYVEAGKWLGKAAEQGNADALYRLGDFHAKGYGVPKDDTKAGIFHRKAAEIYRKSAEQGDADSQFKLGKAYYYGVGVSKSYSEATEWFKKASVQGHNNAQYHLAYCYEKGQGVACNYAEAASWYRKAVVNGHPYAEANLERMKAENKI